MARSKRSIVTVFSVIYLIGLTVIACYAHYNIQRLSLPIPTALSGLAILLPALHGVLIDRLTHLTSKPTSSSSPSITRPRRSSTASYPSPRLRRRRHHTTLTALTLILLTIISTVLATLAGTHIGPASALTCGLEDAWRALYRGGREPEVRRIQDAFDCCGFRSVYDMAWPFAKHDPDTGRTAPSTCARTYGRTRSCLAAWRAEEGLVAGLVVGVCVGVWVWEMIVVYIPARRPSWLSRFREASKPAGHTNGNGDGPRAIGYHDPENGNAIYSDTPIVRVEDADADAEDETGETADSPRSKQGSVQRAIEARLGIDGEHDEHHTLLASSHRAQEENEWQRP